MSGSVLSIIPALLSGKILNKVWTLIGSTAAPAVIAGFRPAFNSGIQVIGWVMDYFHLPVGMGEWFRAVDHWVDTHTEFVATTTALTVIVAVITLGFTSYHPNVLIQGPTAPTFWLAILLWQSTEFAYWPGTVGTIVIWAIGAFFYHKFSETSRWKAEYLLVAAPVIILLHVVYLPIWIASITLLPLKPQLAEVT